MSTLLLFVSAFLHASWNTSAKLSKDKEIFLFWTILSSCCLVFIAILVGSEPFHLGEKIEFVAGAGLFEGIYLLALPKALKHAPLATAYATMRGAAMTLVWMVSLALAIEIFSLAGVVASAVVLFGILLTGLQTNDREVFWRDLGWSFLAAVCIAGYHLCYGESLSAGAEPKSLFFVALCMSLPMMILPVRKNFAQRTKECLRVDRLKLPFAAISTALGFILFLYGLRGAGPGHAITIRNSSILFSFVFSYFIGEKLSRIQIVGVTFIALGALALGIISQ